MAKYNFVNNALEKSKTNNIKNLPKEWIFICRFSYREKDGQCICCRKIKHCNMYYNKFTKNWIIVGDKCKNDLSLSKKKGYLSDIFRNIIRVKGVKGEYVEITDLNKYCENVKKIFIEKCFENNKFDNLHLILKDLENMFPIHQSNILQVIGNSILLKLESYNQNKDLINEILEHLEEYKPKKNTLIIQKDTILTNIRNKITLQEEAEKIRLKHEEEAEKIRQERKQKQKLQRKKQQRLQKEKKNKQAQQEQQLSQENKQELEDWIRGREAYRQIHSTNVEKVEQKELEKNLSIQ